MFISSNSGIQISEELRFFVTTLDLEEAEASPSSPSSPSRARSFTTACHEGGWMAMDCHGHGGIPMGIPHLSDRRGGLFKHLSISKVGRAVVFGVFPVSFWSSSHVLQGALQQCLAELQDAEERFGSQDLRVLRHATAGDPRGIVTSPRSWAVFSVGQMGKPN